MKLLFCVAIVFAICGAVLAASKKHSSKETRKEYAGYNQETDKVMDQAEQVDHNVATTSVKTKTKKNQQEAAYTEYSGYHAQQIDPSDDDNNYTNRDKPLTRQALAGLTLEQLAALQALQALLAGGTAPGTGGTAPGTGGTAPGTGGTAPGTGGTAAGGTDFLSALLQALFGGQVTLPTTPTLPGIPGLVPGILNFIQFLLGNLGIGGNPGGIPGGIPGGNCEKLCLLTLLGQNSNSGCGNSGNNGGGNNNNNNGGGYPYIPTQNPYPHSPWYFGKGPGGYNNGYNNPYF